MKRYIYSLIILPLFALTILQSCDRTSSSQSTDQMKTAFAEIPELLDRSAKIRNGKEWETVQNQYVQNRNAIIADGNNQESKLNLAYVFINEARVTGEHGHYYPAALEVLDQALSASVDKSGKNSRDLRFRALSAKAGVLLSLHQFSAAKRVGEEAIKLNPHNAQIYGVLVDANVEMGNYPQAVDMADKMISIRPDLRSYARVSYLREIHGDVAGATSAMESAVQSGTPGSEELAWTILTLGELYKKYGQTEKAKLAFEAALEVRPDYPFAVGELAALEIEKGNFAKAEKMLNEAAEAIPEFSFYVQLAEIYRATGRAEKAEKTIEEILAMLKDDTDHGHIMNLEFADVFADLKGDFDAALEYALKEFEARPKNIDVNEILATLYLKKGDFTKAKIHAENASATNSKKPELVALLASL